MNETKWTPGPWTNPRYDGRIFGPDGAAIACVWALWLKGEHPEEAARANTCLIVSAPALYEALEAAVENEADYRRINNLPGPDNQWVVNAKAALKAARGE